MGIERAAPGRRQLIGRGVEVQRLFDVVHRRGTCLLLGAAGIGKSLVLREVARRADTDGTEVILLGGTEATGVVPLAPLLRLCPPGADDVGPAIMAELYRRSRERRIVVLVDDAHLLDEATAAVIRQLASAPAFGVAVTVRTGEAVPRPIEALRADGDAVVLELTGLDRRSSHRLVERLLGPTEEQTLEWVFQRSRGHPLYLRELVVAGRETGALQQHGRRWRHDAEAPVWTVRLHALVAARLRDVSLEERRAMELVAIGGTVPLDVARTIVELDVLVRLATRQLLAIEAEAVEIDHPIIAETLSASMPPDRAASARLQLADVMEDQAEDPVTIAQLRLDAGADVGRPQLLAALDAALLTGTPAVAERFARLALEDADDPAVRMSLVASLAIQRHWEEAEEQLQQAVAVCDAVTAAQLLERWVGLNFEFQDRLETTQAVIRDARGRIGAHGSQRWELMQLRLDLFVGDLDQVIADHERWLGDRFVGDELRQLALVDIATAGWHAGAFTRVGRAVAEFERIDAVPDPIEGARLRGVHLASEAWLVGAEAWSSDAMEAMTRATTSPGADVELLAHLHQGMALNDLTRHAEAAEHLRRVMDLTTYARHRRHLPTAQAELARALLELRHDDAAARDWLDSIATLPPETRWVTEPVIQLARAGLAEQAGDDPWPALERGVEQARRRSSRVHEVMLLRRWARLGRPTAAAVRLRELARAVDGGLIQVVAREAEALASSDAASLDDVAADALRFGATGVAADAAAHAGRIHAREGRAGASFASQQACDRVLRHALGQRSVVRDAIDPVLTDREQQVVESVLAGSSNREVADHLYISHRTVESHLRRVYKQLGVANREELTALVTSHPLEDHDHLDRLSAMPAGV